MICLLTFQRRLFEHAASGKSHDAALLKARIARFLHNHKDDWAEGHRRLAGPSIPRGGKTLLAALALGFRWATETADIPSAVFLPVARSSPSPFGLPEQRFGPWKQLGGWDDC